MRKKATENTFLLLSIGSLGAGVLSLYLGIHFSIAVLTGTGLLILGLCLILNGLDDIQQKEVSETYTETAETINYTNGSATAVGLFFCGAGIAFATAGLAISSGHADIWWVFLKSHPGLLMSWGGFEALTFGLHCLLGSVQDRSGILRLLGSLPQRIFGFLLLVAGFLAIISGMLNIFLPGIYQILIVRIF